MKIRPVGKELIHFGTRVRRTDRQTWWN